MHDFHEDLTLTRIAGGSLIKYLPLFSPNGELLFVINGNVVNIFSTTTGEWLKDFENGTAAKLISIQFHSVNKKLLLGCSEFGEIFQWKWKSASLESKLKLECNNCSLKTFNLLDTCGDSPCALITFTKSGFNKVHFAIINIENGKYINCPLDINLSSYPIKVATETQHFHYFILVQKNQLHVVYYKTWKYIHLPSPNNFRITYIISHPTEEMFATGDEMGRIFLWREFKNQNQLHTTLYHWHHTAITSLSFTDSGTGLYSGGQEAVLVKWNLDRPDLREYLPRMTSEIVAITIANKNCKIAVCMADNGIQILGAQNQVKCVLQNFTFVLNNKTKLSKFPIGLQLDPRTNSLVLNGRNGHLQFYSTYTKSLLYNMDIVGQNTLSLESNKILYNTRVMKVGFNVDWMATGEVWDDQEHTPELRIKFWEFNKEKQTYSLNTIVELPHQGGFKAIQFSSLFQTDDLLCATAGHDNILKIWSLQESDNVFKKGTIWSCIAQTKYKDLCLNSVNFSEDGSLISAGFGNCLCVFRSDSLKIKAILSAPSGYDGSVQKVEICLSKLNDNNRELNSVKNETSIKVIQQFNKFLDGNDNSLTKAIQNFRKIKTLPKSKSVKIAYNHKELFQTIQSLSDLNFFQKILLHQKLKIFCTISEESKPLFLSYLSSTFFKFSKQKKKLFQFIHSISNRDRFKAKYRLAKISLKNRLFNDNVNNKVVPILRLLNINEAKKMKHKDKNKMSNGVETIINGDSKKKNNDSCLFPKLQKGAQIKTVQFATGEFSHLVVVSTERRILIWNLLTLKLQSVLKLSSRTIAIDPLTSLCAIFTIQNELYIFRPNATMTLYHRIDLPKTIAACWVPRRNPKTQSFNICWQSISTLYFLTENQDLMYLSSPMDDDSTVSTVAYLKDAQDIARYSTFGTFAMNQMQETLNKINLKNTTIGTLGKPSIKSVIEMSTHTMAPVNILCLNFMKSLVIIENVSTVPATQDKNLDETIVHDAESDDDSNEINSKLKLRKIAEKSKELRVNKTFAIENLKLEQELEKVFLENLSIDL